MLSRFLFSTRPTALSLATLSLLGLTAQRPVAAALTLNTFTNPHTALPNLGGTIGFAYAGNIFVGSVQGDGKGQLYSTDLSGGDVQLFAPTVSLIGSPSSEHYVSSSLGLGGFPDRDVYVAAGNTVVHISHDGTTSDTFVSGLVGGVRGILFDAVGTFGHDMLVTTNAGSVYRINSSGTASLLASTGEDTEGLDVAPLGDGFGTFDGQLVVASEGSGLLRAISPTGTVTVLNKAVPIAGAEELSFVPQNLGMSGSPVEGFYGSDYTQNVVKADTSQFQNFLGDVIVTGEFNHLVNRVHWNGSSFDVTQIGAFPSQPEDGIFVTQAIIQGSTVPEPGPLALLTLGLLPVGLLARRRMARKNA